MKGHVYRRGTSWSYLFDIEADPLTVKRRQANGSGFKTEREAWKACRTAMADYEKGRVVRSSRRKWPTPSRNGWAGSSIRSSRPWSRTGGTTRPTT